MCRFVYYQGQPLHLSALLTEPGNSLIHQSVHAHERAEPLNGDGFGVAWYPEDANEPALFKSVSPAWSNENLKELARTVTSRRVLAHVRAASPGFGVSEANSHPFRSGGLTFMDNGHLGGFESFRRVLLHELSDSSFGRVHGRTDSEHFFALIADSIERRASGESDTARLGTAFEQALGKALAWRSSFAPDQHFYLNCVLADERTAVACRFTTDAPEKADSLYTHFGKEYHCAAGDARLRQCRTGLASVLVASEPLTDDPDWNAVPVGQLVSIEADQTVHMRPIRVSA
jgi:glutamine amidotransferase